jgi:hypothetical protein
MDRLPLRPADGLALPDLQEWMEFYGGYQNIPPEAWAEWELLCAAYRERQRIEAIRLR